MKINKINQESHFLNSFMPYLKYILSSKDLNLKLINRFNKKFFILNNCNKKKFLKKKINNLIFKFILKLKNKKNLNLIFIFFFKNT